LFLLSLPAVATAFPFLAVSQGIAVLHWSHAPSLCIDAPALVRALDEIAKPVPALDVGGPVIKAKEADLMGLFAGSLDVLEMTTLIVFGQEHHTAEEFAVRDLTRQPLEFGRRRRVCASLWARGGVDILSILD
jgi:hypothetical protein